MTQWNRTTLPTEADSDEWGNILVLRSKGRKTLDHWMDYCDEKEENNQLAWMSLPMADDVEDAPEPISIVITAGDRQVAIYKNGNTIEVHTSEDLMGQPAVWEDDLGGIEGLLATVETVLTDDLMRQLDDDEDATYQYADDDEGGPVAVNDTVLQGFIDAIRGSETEDNCCNELDILKKSELSYAGVVERLRRRISHLESGSETASVPASKPKPWQKNRGK